MWSICIQKLWVAHSPTHHSISHKHQNGITMNADIGVCVWKRLFKNPRWCAFCVNYKYIVYILHFVYFESWFSSIQNLCIINNNRFTSHILMSPSGCSRNQIIWRFRNIFGCISECHFNKYVMHTPQHSTAQHMDNGTILIGGQTGISTPSSALNLKNAWTMFQSYFVSATFDLLPIATENCFLSNKFRSLKKTMLICAIFFAPSNITTVIIIKVVMEKILFNQSIAWIF